MGTMGIMGIMGTWYHGYDTSTYESSKSDNLDCYLLTVRSCYHITDLNFQRKIQISLSLRM